MQKDIINDDMAVITLPMKPHRKEKIGMIVIPSIADVFAKRLGAKSYLGINLMDSYVKREDFVTNYYDLLYQMNIDFDSVWVDKEEQETLFKNVQKLIDNGFVKEKNMNMLRCPCGVIDMKMGSENDFVTKRSYEVRNDEIYCKECGKICKCVKENVLVFNSGNIEFKGETIPSRISKEQQEFHQKLKNEDILVSRLRNTNIPVVVNGKKYNIDVDFAVLTYLACFDEKRKVIIGSNHHIYQMYLMELLSKCLGKESENVYVAIPYVKPPKGQDFDLKKELFSLKNQTREAFIFGNAFKFKNNVNSWSTDFLKFIKKLDDEEVDALYKKITTPIKISDGTSLQVHVNNAIKSTNIQRTLNQIHSERGNSYEK